jgi:hypothetical protein
MDPWEEHVWIACPTFMGPKNTPATLGQQPKDSGQSDSGSLLGAPHVSSRPSFYDTHP